MALPNDQRAQVRLATLLKTSGRQDEAIGFLEDLLKKHPSCVAGQELLGEIYFTRGDVDRATICLETAVKFTKTKEERIAVNFKLGTAYAARQRYELARARFRDVLRDYPQHKSATMALRMLDQVGKVGR